MLGQQRLRTGIGMDAVVLQQRRVEPIAIAKGLEEERHERRARALGELDIDGLEGLGVCPAVVGGQPHAEQQHARAVRLDTVDDRFQVGAHLVKGDAPKAVVSSELDDDDARIVARQRFGQPGASPVGGVPAHAGIDDPVGMAGLV